MSNKDREEKDDWTQTSDNMGFFSTCEVTKNHNHPHRIFKCTKMAFISQHFKEIFDFLIFS